MSSIFIFLIDIFFEFKKISNKISLVLDVKNIIREASL